jgi:hypothetical protein
VIEENEPNKPDPEIIERYRRAVRLRQRILIAIAVSAACSLIAARLWETELAAATGLPRGTFVIGLIILFGVALTLTFFNWRCPACNKKFGLQAFPRYCPRCGDKLRG